ncbi:hypothetical protein pb186bvf_008625 [Paramecium bursaria]
MRRQSQFLIRSKKDYEYDMLRFKIQELKVRARQKIIDVEQKDDIDRMDWQFDTKYYIGGNQSRYMQSQETLPTNRTKRVKSQIIDKAQPTIRDFNKQLRIIKV